MQQETKPRVGVNLIKGGSLEFLRTYSHIIADENGVQYFIPPICKGYGGISKDDTSGFFQFLSYDELPEDIKEMYLKGVESIRQSSEELWERLDAEFAKNKQIKDTEVG